MVEFRIPLVDFVQTMSTAADLISEEVAKHHQRVAYIAHRLAGQLGHSSELRQDLVVAASLHDLGAFSLQERTDLLEFELRSPQRHAEFGYAFFRSFGPLARVARIIRYHHHAWDQGDGAMVDGQEVPEGSFLLQLADRVDVASYRRTNILAEIGSIVDQVQAHSGRLFVPEHVAAFGELAQMEYFWLDLRSPALDDILRSSLDVADIVIDAEGMVELARMLARLVDFKSQYTSTHTAGVAHSAAVLAACLGLDAERQQQLLLAGYLHDVGKVAIPREILDKPSGLDLAEFGVIKSHAYHTKRILETIDGMREIAKWASSHHEHLDGSGYPFHLTDMPLESRIVAVADVFTALAEDRPYRDGMAPVEIARMLRKMVEVRKLDHEVVECLLAHQEEVDRARIDAQAHARAEYAGMLRRAEEVG